MDTQHDSTEFRSDVQSENKEKPPCPACTRRKKRRAALCALMSVLLVVSGIQFQGLAEAFGSGDGEGHPVVAPLVQTASEVSLDKQPSESADTLMKNEAEPPQVGGSVESSAAEDATEPPNSETSQTPDKSDTPKDSEESQPPANPDGSTDSTNSTESENPQTPNSPDSSTEAKKDVSESADNLSSPSLLADGASLVLTESGWGATIDKFVVSSQVSVPKGFLDNVMVIQLPQYVELATDLVPDASKNIKKITKTGSANEVGGTTITVTIFDASAGLTAGLDFSVNQALFKENARPATTGSTYKISVEFTSGGAVSQTKELSFTPDVRYDNFTFSGTTARGKAIDLDATDEQNRLNIVITGVFDWTDHMGDLGTASLHVPLATLPYDVDEIALSAAGGREEGGELIVPYSLTQVSPDDPKKIVVPLPLKINPEKTLAWFRGIENQNEKLKTQVYVELDDGTKLNPPYAGFPSWEVRMPMMMFGEVGSRYGNNRYQTLFNSYYLYKSSVDVQSDLSIEYPFDLRLWKPEKPTETASAGEIDPLLNKDAFSNFTVSFTIPNGLEWNGNSSYYQTATRTVTLPLEMQGIADGTNEDSGYKLSIVGGSNTLPFRVADKSLLVGSNVDFQLSNVLLSATREGESYVMPSCYTPKWTVRVSSYEANLKFTSYNYKSAENTEDSTLYELMKDQSYQSGYREDLPIAMQATVDPSFFPVSTVQGSQTNLDMLRAGGRKVELYYTTTAHNDKANPQKSDLLTDIQLPAGEYLTWWQLRFPDGLVKDSVNSFLSFRGHTPEVDADIAQKTDMEVVSPSTGKPILMTSTPSTTSTIYNVVQVKNPIETATVNKSVRYNDAVDFLTIQPRTFEASEINSLENEFYEVEFDLPTHVRINSMKYISNGSSFYSGFLPATYTTNLNATPRQYKGITLELAPGEYFTSLSYKAHAESILPGKVVFSGLVDPAHQIVDGEEDHMTVRVPAAKNLEEQVVEVTLPLTKQVDVSVGASVLNSAQFDWTPTVTSAQAGQVASAFELKPSNGRGLALPLRDIGLTDEDAAKVTVKNPTFYLEMPRWLNYVEGSFAIGGYEGKTPKVTRIAGATIDSSYLKVEYYGATGSSTGIELATGPEKGSEYSISLKAYPTEFAKRGSQRFSMPLYVDLSQTLSELRSQGIAADYLRESPGQNMVANTATINDAGDPVEVSLCGGTGSVTVLQYTSSVFSAGVSTEDDATPRTSASMLSGQTFNAFLDIVNNASEMQDFVMYIPVAREGHNSGGGVAEWSAQLASAIVTGSATSVNVEFSTSDNPTMAGLEEGVQDPAGMYRKQNQVANLADVTMVKLTFSSLAINQTLNLSASFKSLGEKTRTGDLTDVIVAQFAYRNGGVWQVNRTSDISITLTDTKISGKVWDDADADGMLDPSEAGRSNHRLVLHAADGSNLAEAFTATDGTYSFERVHLSEGSYLTVDKPSRKALTYVHAVDVPLKQSSSFEQDTYRANLTLGRTSNVNAGFVDAQDLTFDPETYTVRKGQQVDLRWKLDPATPMQTLSFSSSDAGVATVDSDGRVTGVTEGNTNITASFELLPGLQVQAQARVTVESNNPPVVTVPRVIELNQGDAWDARDASIVTGLSVSDDHDVVSLDRLDVSGDTFARSGTARDVGAYDVAYSYTDDDGNVGTATLLVRVHGKPYLTLADGTPVGSDGVPTRYVRLDESLNPFSDVKAWWLQAPESSDPTLRATLHEIVPTDSSTGTFSLVRTYHEDGTPAPTLDVVGAYKGDYHLETPKGGTADATRPLIARGKLNLFSNSIAVPSTAPVTQFATFADFVAVYGDRLGLSAGVDVYDEVQKKVVHLDLTDNIVCPGISAIDFTLNSDGTSKSIPLTLKVTDTTTADTFGDKTVEFNIVVTVLNAVGQPPTISFDTLENPLLRVASDSVREDPTEGSPDLPDSELYGKLLRDATFADTDGTIVSEAIIGGSVLTGGDGVTIDVTNGASLRKMLTTTGSYELLYETVDNDGNTVTSTREFRVAGATKFVTGFGTPAQADAPSVLNFRQRSVGEYSPAGVVSAYHVDSDGATPHQMPVTATGSVNLANIGATEVTAKSQHHYNYWPATTLLRPLDEFTQTVLVHGPIQFGGDKDDVEVFTDESVSVNGVTASFVRALPGAGSGAGSTSVESLVVTSDATASEVTSANPGMTTVTYEASDAVSHSDSGNRAELEREISFFGLPSITAPTTPVVVRTNASHQEVVDAIAATAQIELPDASDKDLTTAIDYDFTGLTATGGTVHLSVAFAIAGGAKERTAEADVPVEVSAPPVIEAHDIVLNVGEKLAVLAQSGATVSDDRDTIDAASLTVDSAVPVDGEGRVTTAGTTAVRLWTKDSHGNVGEKFINVRVNGLPVIDGAPNIVARVGDSLSTWDVITVTWDRAPVSPGSAERVTFHYGDDLANGSIELTNYRQVEPGGAEHPVDASALNIAGLYKGDYVAKTPTGGTTTETRTLKLHGKPKVNAIGVTAAMNAPAPSSSDEFLSTYGAALSATATTKHVSDDGLVENIDLYAGGKVTVDFSRVKFGVKGVYDLVVNALDEAPGMDPRTYSTTVKMTIDDFNGTPPSIVTNEVQRVSTDPVLKEESQTYEAYLLSSRFATVTKGDWEPDPLMLIKMEKTTGPSLADPSVMIADGASENLDRNNNGLSEDELELAFRTVGSYRITYQVSDSKFNKVEDVAVLDVAGSTEFGYGSDDNFTELGTSVEARQTAGATWAPSGLRARHQDMSGEWHSVVIDPVTETPDGLALDEVRQLAVTVSAAHHRGEFEDGSLRPHDKRAFNLRVQGRPTIEGIDETLVTYAGDTPNPLERLSSSFSYVNDSGTIERADAKLSADNVPSGDQVGMYDVTVRATDETTGAPDATTTGVRSVAVNGVPRLEYNSSVSIPTNASENQIKNRMGVRATYEHAVKGTVDITDQVEMDINSLDTSKTGETLMLDLTLPYQFDPPSAQRTVTGKVRLYVDAPPTMASVSDDINVGAVFDPMAGMTFSDLEDGVLPSSAVTVTGAGDVNMSAAGTYGVSYRITDSAGNEKDIERAVRVHGLPVISGVRDLTGRVGEELPSWDGVTVSWLKAGQRVGDVPETITFSHDEGSSTLGSVDLSNYRLVTPTGEEPTDASALGTPGLYKIDYAARTPFGGTTSVTHTVMLHGLPSVSASDISVALTEVAPESAANFLTLHANELAVRAKTSHVESDGSVSEIDLLQADKVSIDISSVRFGEKGVYEVPIVVVDETADAGTRTATTTVNVTIDDYNGIPPVVRTNDVSRVSGDPVLKGSEPTLRDYLLSGRFFTVEKKDWDVTRKDVVKVERIAPGAIENMDRDDNGLSEDELAATFDTMGTYRVTYEVEDAMFNRVKAEATLSVYGATEFGTGEGSEFVKLGGEVQARQLNGGLWAPVDIMARYQGADGLWVTRPVGVAEATDGLGLDDVAVLPVTLSAMNYSGFYEDGTDRPKDQFDLKVLVQGAVTIDFPLLPVVVYEGDAIDDADVLDGVTASFKHIDKNGAVVDTSANLSVASKPSADRVGMVEAEVQAEDVVSGAPRSTTVGMRSVAVNGVPQLTCNSSVTVPTNASVTDVLNALDVRATYEHAVRGSQDISSAVEMDVQALDTSKAGETLTLDIAVPYTLDEGNNPRRVEKQATIYIDAPPVMSTEGNQFNAGEVFDPLKGVTLTDPEDGELDVADALVMGTDVVNEGKPGTYRVLYTISDSGGNKATLERIVRVHGLPVITDAPNELSMRVGSLPVNPLAGVVATYLKATDTPGEQPVETPLSATEMLSAPASVMALLASDDTILARSKQAGIMFSLVDLSGNQLATPPSDPGLYRGVVTATTPTGATTTTDVRMLAHGVPQVSSTGLTITQGDGAAIDVARLVSDGGLAAKVEHVHSGGTVVHDALPASSFSIVSNSTDVATPGTYSVKVSVTDDVAPVATTEADIAVTVQAAGSGGSGSGGAGSGNGGAASGGSNSTGGFFPFGFLPRTGDLAGVLFAGCVGFVGVAGVALAIAMRRRKKNNDR